MSIQRKETIYQPIKINTEELLKIFFLVAPAIDKNRIMLHRISKVEYQTCLINNEKFLTPKVPILMSKDEKLKDTQIKKGLIEHWQKFVKAVDIIQSPAVGYRDGNILKPSVLETIRVGDYLAETLDNPEIWLPFNMELSPGNSYQLTHRIERALPIKTTVWRPVTIDSLFQQDKKDYREWKLKFGVSIQPPNSPNRYNHDFTIKPSLKPEI